MSDSNLIRSAKNWDIFAKVAFAIFRAAAIVCAVCAVLLLLFGSKVYTADSYSLDLAWLKIYLTEDFYPTPQSMQLFLVISLTGIGAACGTVAYILHQLRGVLAPMQQGRPFAADTPRKLRNMAWAVLLCGGITQLTAIAVQILLSETLPLSEIFSSPAIARLEISISMDMGFALGGLLLLFLSYIFSYGHKLQQESDETL